MLGVMLPKETGCCPKAWGMPGRYCACKGELWCCFVQGPLPCAVADIIFGMTREVPIVAKRL